MNESVIYLPQVGSTNAWAKENIAQFGPVGAVYTVVRVLGCLRRIKAALWH